MRKFLPLLILTLLSLNGFTAEKPNFVWIISEDNSHHYLEHFFPGGAPTPNIVTMAAHGITYDHAFSNAPVCSVARSTLITGCYAPRIGTQYHRRSALVPMPEGVRMFPAYLRDAGYYTSNNSKTDYNAIASDDVWDDSSNKSSWKNRQPGQPFFHKVSYAQSHEGSLHFSADQMANQKTITDPTTVPIPPYHPDTPTFRYTHARYRDNIRTIDELVGKVISQLEADGELENTFVFYFGDHGGVLPRGKGYAYESGLHVPLVVRVPKNFKHLVQANLGARAKGFVSFIDFGPTIQHLAGATIPSNIDGTPFLGPNISWDDVEKRQTAFGYADRFDEKYDLVRTIRIGNFTYQRNFQPFNFDALYNDYRYKMIAYREWRELYKTGKLTPAQSQFHQPRAAEALYDINNDPHEVNNLATNPAHAEKLKELRDQLTTHLKATNDLSFYPEPYMVTAALTNPVEFGQNHSREIATLIDLANLQLGTFDTAKQKLTEALNNKDPWHRYWACIVATSFGKNAAELTPLITQLSNQDPEPLVRTRAAEFIGLTQTNDPRPAIMTALKMANSEITTTLILNSAVLLQDSPPGYQFKITPTDLNHSARLNQDRLNYLSGTPSQPSKKPGKKKPK